MHQVDPDAGWRSENVEHLVFPFSWHRFPWIVLCPLSHIVSSRPAGLSDSNVPPAALMSVNRPAKSSSWVGAASKAGSMCRGTGNPVIFPNVTRRRLRFVRGQWFATPEQACFRVSAPALGTLKAVTDFRADGSFRRSRRSRQWSRCSISSSRSFFTAICVNLRARRLLLWAEEVPVVYRRRAFRTWRQALPVP
jgi:hypothetical protein